jgi:hypothetical protein
VQHFPLAELDHVSSPRALRIACIALVAALGCAGVKTNSQSGSGGSSGGGGNGGSTTVIHENCMGPCPDFQVGTIGTPSGNFGSPTGAGPCIDDPQDGSLFPANWLQPRVHVTDGPGAYKITFHADMEANDLVVYINTDHYELDKAIWQGLARHIVSTDITVKVQKAGGGESSVKFQIAPVGATGTMVFWAANPALVGAMPQDCYKNVALCSNASELRGFSVGDASTETVLSISQVMQPSRAADSGNPAPVICIGCHGATPDDTFVSIDDHYAWRSALAGVGMTNEGAAWTTTASGLAALQQPGWGPMTWTDKLWSPGMRIGVGSLGLLDPTKADWSNGPDQNDMPHLAWLNVEAPNPHVHNDSDPGNWAFPSYVPNTGVDSGNSLGIMPNDCPAGGAATPNFKHSGDVIAFACTNASISGRLNQEVANPTASSDPTQNGTKQNPDSLRRAGMTDIYLMPFNGGNGGHTMPVNGAATPDFEEYYPAFSPDDKFIAFTRVPKGQVMFANPNAEIAIVDPSGNAQVLAANTPAQCTGKTSPGVNNHWPKWSPEVQGGGNGTYYWLVFSSTRTGIPPVADVTGTLHQISQLYMAPVVVTETNVTSYPAIYLWNQPTDRVNTTPAWATFSIPPVP